MGFEQLINIAEYNREQERIGEELAREPTECPYDEWPLDINSKGERSCPICERIWK
uniref:Uncharacterized protein n=1 Tax=viral metagenome TaxID=1070528 RepID=A0A6M3IPI6_9ZZZZ